MAVGWVLWTGGAGWVFVKGVAGEGFACSDVIPFKWFASLHGSYLLVFQCIG